MTLAQLRFLVASRLNVLQSLDELPRYEAERQLERILRELDEMLSADEAEAA